MNLAKVGKTLYFSAEKPATGGELYKSNGTRYGTRKLKDVNPGLASSSRGASPPTVARSTFAR